MHFIKFLAVFAALFFLLGCIGIATEPLLKHTVEIGSSACKGSVAYLAELKTQDGHPISDEPLQLYADGKLLDVIRTDKEGKISAKFDAAEWCGKKVNFEIKYPGSAFYAPAASSDSGTVKKPSKLIVSYPKSAVAGEEFTINVHLADALSSAPITGEIVFSGQINQKQPSNANGDAKLKITYPDSGDKIFGIIFQGNGNYEGSSAPDEAINIAPAGCMDGAAIKTCSLASVGYYCSEEKQLLENCSLCGCPLGLYCADKACVTTEDRTKILIDKIEKSVVLVQSDQGLGSGVILDYNDGNIVITNRHVVDVDEDLGGVTGLFVKTYDGKILHPKQTFIEPGGLDLAVLTFADKIGESAHLDSQYVPTTGDDVLILGSPLGIQHSVSKGIVSNYGTLEGQAGEYVQTDAAVNPGNSGGGMFLIKSGKLIGINTFGFRLEGNTPLEGLNFAIHLKELNFSSTTWLTFVPKARCSDGTAYNKCSVKSSGQMCSSVSISLVPKCSVCGCGKKSGYDSYCLKESETCSYCQSGYGAYKSTAGNFYCCKPGTVLTCSDFNDCSCK